MPRYFYDPSTGTYGAADDLEIITVPETDADEAEQALCDASHAGAGESLAFILNASEERRYCVDGHQFDNPESDLLGDGGFAPFYVFDIAAQAYLPYQFATRADAEPVAAYLNKPTGAA